MRLTEEQITNRINLQLKDGLSPIHFDGDKIEYYDFQNVRLRYVSFMGTTFNDVCFDNVSFVDCDFSGARFLRCSFYGTTDFQGTCFDGAKFIECDGLDKLDEAKGVYFPLACPEEGGFIGWKKAYAPMTDDTGHMMNKPVIVKLFIPPEAKRSSAMTRKCRCDKAKVLDITDLDGTVHYLSAHSGYDHSFNFFVYDEVSVDDFDDNRWNECSTGIHFFITREEAVNY